MDRSSRGASSNGHVRNVVIKALLESLFDILDRDGERSILHHAHCEDVSREELKPDGKTSLDTFNRIVQAMNELLCFSTVILNEIGRKFAVYSDPKGSGIDVMVARLREWIQTDWEIRVTERGPDKIVVGVKNCPFCLATGMKEPCEILRGFLCRTVSETSRNPESVVCTEHPSHVFTIHLDNTEGPHGN